MKKRTFDYEAPMVEVLAVEVEKGFALSTDQLPSWGDGDAVTTSSLNDLF